MSERERELSDRYQRRKTPYDLLSSDALDRQNKLESNARTYSRRLPIVLRQACGVYVEDVNGNVYIDCLAGAGSLALGHNHPVILQAMRRALDDGVPMQTLDLMTPLKDAFIQDLFSVLPREFASNAKIQFCGPSGTDAVEAALKLVRTATRRSNLAAFHGAYHGMTQGSLQLMGNLGPKGAIGGALNVQFLPYPNSYRCPFGLGKMAGEQAGLNYINSILTDPESGVPKPAGIILELVQGEGGVLPAPDSWTRRLKDIAVQVDVPLIIDEVQTGLGRTGRLFAIEHSGITPDVLVLSKAIGGGQPMSVIVYDARLDLWEPGAHAGTFRGNQLAMAAGSATIQFVKKEALHDQAHQKGIALMRLLNQLREDCAFIGEVRGRGLMIGVEFRAEVTDGTIGPSAGQIARAVQSECLRRGLILELGGRGASVARFLPPLTVSDFQIELIFEVFASAVHCVEHYSFDRVRAQ